MLSECGWSVLPHLNLAALLFVFRLCLFHPNLIALLFVFRLCLSHLIWLPCCLCAVCLSRVHFVFSVRVYTVSVPCIYGVLLSDCRLSVSCTFCVLMSECRLSVSCTFCVLLSECTLWLPHSTSGVLLSDCGGKVCLNKGKLDVDTCQCQCQCEPSWKGEKCQNSEYGGLW